MHSSTIHIRRFAPSDWAALWPILQAEFAAGESHPQPSDISEQAAYQGWIESPEATFVAVHDGALLGTYVLKSNQPGRGAHVCNCGYIVAPSARRQGIGRALCRHSLDEACQRGYLAMQYNLVVSCNHAAVRLWQDMGFDTVGRLPEAFHHPRHGLVDALVMMRSLRDRAQRDHTLV